MAFLATLALQGLSSGVMDRKLAGTRAAALERTGCGRRRVALDNPLELDAYRPHRKSREESAMRMIDLSRELYHRTPTYPGQPPIIHGVWKTHEESFVESGNVHGNCVMFFSMPDHGGTPAPAPPLTSAGAGRQSPSPPSRPAR